MQKIEQTISSKEAAEMIGKEHAMLLRDLRRYINQFNDCNLAVVDFFQESTYVDSKGETRPCYQITKKGCEFIAHKLTGVKGTAFTARYINRFHEMEERLSVKSHKPWYIREFRGKEIVLFRDFKTLTGIELLGNYTSLKRANNLIAGIHHNGWGCRCDNEAFKAEYGFDYGEADRMDYLYIRGLYKALQIMIDEEDVAKKDIARRLLAEVNRYYKVEPKREVIENKPLQISITVNGQRIDIS